MCVFGCVGNSDFLARIKHMCVRSRSGSERDLMDAAASSEDRYEFSMDAASSGLSMDGLSLDLLGDGALSFSTLRGEDHVGSSSRGSSSSLGWPLAKVDPSPASSNGTSARHTYMWEEKRDRRDTELAGDFYLCITTFFSFWAFCETLLFLCISSSII